jgi:hypothetical protein
MMQRVCAVRRLAFGISLFGLMAAAPVHAQQAGDAEAIGLRLGTAIAKPQLEIGTSLSRGDDAGGVDIGAQVFVKPSLDIETDWSRHRATFNVSGTLEQDVDGGSPVFAEGAAGAGLRIDLRRGTTLDVAGDYDFTRDASIDQDTLDTSVDRTRHTGNGSAALAHDFGGLETRVRGGLQRQVFDDVTLGDGTVEDNGDRDQTTYDLALRGTLNAGAVFNPFAEVGVDRRVHDQRLDRNGIARDSIGYRGSIGLRIDDDPLWAGEIAATYVVRDYDDAALSRQQAPGLAADLAWRPTDLTTVTLTAAVEINDTVDATDSGVAVWSTSVAVRHALLENLELFASLNADFEKDGSGTDVNLAAGFGAEWSFNPVLAGRLAYAGSWYDSADAGADASEHSVLASLVLRR